MTDFSNKTVLVTGGSRGIGKAICTAFAAAGARVALNFRRNSEAARQTITELAGDGHLAVKANMADPKAVQRMLDTVLTEFGQLDILVNNAGVYLSHPVADTSFTDWQKSWADTLAVNLFGPANLSYLAARHMIERQQGRIINITSRGAYRGEPDHAAYGASKAALNSLTQSLARALGPHNIAVSAVAPGFIETDMAAEYLNGEQGEAIRAQSPLNRVGQPEEIAKAVLYLASEDAAYASGAILDVNGASYLR